MSVQPLGTLVRRLGLWASIGLVIGVTIGSGIFRTPAGIAARVPDPQPMLAVWLIGGLISRCGALAVAELAASLPQTGGWYVYLHAVAATAIVGAALINIRGVQVGAVFAGLSTIAKFGLALIHCGRA